MLLFVGCYLPYLPRKPPNDFCINRRIIINVHGSQNFHSTTSSELLPWCQNLWSESGRNLNKPWLGSSICQALSTFQHWVEAVQNTVYQPIGLFLGPLKCCADNIRQRLPVHLLLLRNHYVVRCYMRVWAKSANDNDRQVRLHFRLTKLSNVTWLVAPSC